VNADATTVLVGSDDASGAQSKYPASVNMLGVEMVTGIVLFLS
jgi:hypothetical protein